MDNPQEDKQPQEVTQELKIDSPQELKNHNDITGFLKIRVAGKLSPEEQKILFSNIREAHQNKGVKVYVVKKYYKNVSTLHIYNKGVYVPRGQHKRPKKYNVKPRAPRPKKNYYKPTGRSVGCPKGTKHKQHKPHIFTKKRASNKSPRKDKGTKRTSYKKTHQEDLLNNLKNELSQEEYNKLLSIINKNNTKEELSISKLSVPVC